MLKAYSETFSITKMPDFTRVYAIQKETECVPLHQG